MIKASFTRLSMQLWPVLVFLVLASLRLGRPTPRLEAAEARSTSGP